MSLTEIWSSLAHNAAMNRLIYWQGELMQAQKAGDQARALECARFIEEYGKLIADMLATKPPEPT